MANGSTTPHVNRKTDSGTQVPTRVLCLDKVIPSELTLLDDAVAEVTAAIDRTAFWEDAGRIGLVLQEALVNAIVHGCHCEPQKTVRVCVAVYDNRELVIVVKDSGSGFDPNRLPDPTAAENLLAGHGRGVFLMKELMDEVDFKFDHGTEVSMRRSR
jgi:serine/threonine-protein kinase RsbW